MRSHRPFSQALRLPKPPPTVAGLYTQKEFEAKRAYNVDKLQVKSRTHPLPLSRMHVCTGGRAWGFCFHTGRLPLPPPRMPAVLACAWAVRLCAQHRPAGGRLPALELAAGGALAGRAGLVGRAGAERGLGAHPGALGRGQSCLVDLSLQPNCLLGGQLVCDTTWRPMCSLGTCLGPAMSLAGPAPRQLSANRLLRMHALQAGVTLLLGLPWSWYSTFVLEARHGFNKTSLRTFVADTAKSVGGRQELGQVCAASIVTRVQAGRGAGEGGPCGGCGVTSTSHVPCATERRRCSCWRTRLAPVRRCRRAGPPPPGRCAPQVLLGLLLLPPVVAGFTAILQRASPWVGLQVRPAACSPAAAGQRRGWGRHARQGLPGRPHRGGAACLCAGKVRHGQPRARARCLLISPHPAHPPPHPTPHTHPPLLVAAVGLPAGAGSVHDHRLPHRHRAPLQQVCPPGGGAPQVGLGQPLRWLRQ